MAKKKLTKVQKRKARLRKAKQWILIYRGSDLLHDYGKRYGVDPICAAKDLEAFGASTDEQLQLLQQREQARLQKKREDREAKLQIELEKRLENSDAPGGLDSTDNQETKNISKAKTQTKKRSKRRCENCGRVMKQQFIGLKHCKCGTSWSKAEGYFERTSNMVFALHRKVTKKGKNSIRTKQVPVIRYKRDD